MENRFRRLYTPLFLYLAAVNVVVIAAVTVLHELGHAVVGILSGCTAVQIVLLGGQATYATMTCPTDPGTLLLFASAFLFPVPVAAAFLLLHRFKERYIGFIILGLAVIMAATDLHLLVASPGIRFVTVLIGAVIALYGEDRLVHETLHLEIAREAHTTR